MQRHRFTAWLEPHTSTCVGDCMYIVLRFWRSSVRTRLVSDAGCTRWAHLGRGPHCRPMGLELSWMPPVPRRGNRDSRCGVGLYCARRLSALVVSQKRHSPAGRVRIQGICAATGFTAVISSSTACLTSSRATGPSISFVFSSDLFHNLFHEPRLVFHSMFHSLSISRCPARFPARCPAQYPTGRLPPTV